MKNGWKIAVVGAVLLAVVGIVTWKIGPTGTTPAAPPPAELSAALPAPSPAAVPSGAVCPVQPDSTASASCALPSPSPKKAAPAAPTRPAAPASPSPAKPAPATAPSLPRLLDLGSTTCIPCKMMVPVMEALRQKYAGKLVVEFLDVNENSAAGEKYQVQSLPTQILFDRQGHEVFRHLGFWPQEEIVVKCQELGLLPKETS